MASEQPTARHRGPIPPIPVSILTGFLGAGKTTLLSALLKQPGMAETAVIINEFGEISLDHLLVETADEGIVELKGGCLCCSIRGDLIQTLEDLLRARDNGRVTKFNRVVIETTGLADPAPVLHSVMFHPYLVMRYKLDSVVTVVDAINGMATLDAHEEPVRQAAVADRIVLTKTDLPEGQANADALKSRLKALNPAARLLNAAAGEAIAERLFDAGLYNPATKSPDVARWLRVDAYSNETQGHDHGHDHHHDHDHGHGHDHSHAHDRNRHDDRIRAFTVAHDHPMALSALESFLDLIRSQHGEKLLRVKGIINVADQPDQPLVIHGVQHVFHPPVFLSAWPDDDRSTRLVFITRDADPEQIEGLLKAFAKPDRAGPTFQVVSADNPLSGGSEGPFRP